MPENAAFATWAESRRLMVRNSPRRMPIKDLGNKIDQFNDHATEKAPGFASETQTGIAELNLRVAILEMRAKM